MAKPLERASYMVKSQKNKTKSYKKVCLLLKKLHRVTKSLQTTNQTPQSFNKVHKYIKQSTKGVIT